VEAIFDTSDLDHQEGFERGIHVHGRKTPHGPKHINQTYSSVRISNLPFPGFENVVIGWELAIYFVIVNCLSAAGDESPDFREEVETASPLNGTSVTMDYLDIARTMFLPPSSPNVDAYIDFFANLNKGRDVIRPNQAIDISASEIREGVQIWGSNKAIIWLAPHDEEEGIHVHGFSPFGTISIDGTFDTVLLQGRSLDDAQARLLMAQAQIPRLSSHLASLNCPNCSRPHVDRGRAALIPHISHSCEFCGTRFRCEPEMRPRVSNPAFEILLAAQEAASVHSRTPPLHSLTP